MIGQWSVFLYPPLITCCTSVFVLVASFAIAAKIRVASRIETKCSVSSDSRRFPRPRYANYSFCERLVSCGDSCLLYVIFIISSREVISRPLALSGWVSVALRHT